MFPTMRRHRQQLSQAQCEAIWAEGTSGVLAVQGEDGYPYAVPLSYVYHDGKFYFHSAPAGHKLDAVRRCPKVSFCVIALDEIHPETFTTHFRSAVAFGQVRVLEDREEKLAAIRLLADKYSPGQAGREAEISQSFDHLCMLELTVEHMTGKEAIELTREREGGHAV